MTTIHGLNFGPCVHPSLWLCVHHDSVILKNSLLNRYDLSGTVVIGKTLDSNVCRTVSWISATTAACFLGTMALGERKANFVLGTRIGTFSRAFTFDGMPSPSGALCARACEKVLVLRMCMSCSVCLCAVL
jgi:hypothetical protein